MHIRIFICNACIHGVHIHRWSYSTGYINILWPCLCVWDVAGLYPDHCVKCRLIGQYFLDPGSVGCAVGHPVRRSSCTQVILYAGHPVHRSSCTQIILCAGHPVHRSSCTQIILCAGHPVRRSSCAQVILYAGHPVRRSSCAQVILYTDHPVHRSSCAQVILYADHPVRRSSCTQVVLYTSCPLHRLFYMHVNACDPVHRCFCTLFVSYAGGTECVWFCYKCVTLMYIRVHNLVYGKDVLYVMSHSY